MKIGNYKINSTVVMASIVAFIAGLIDFLTNGAVVSILSEFLLQFMGNPEIYRPYMTERVYQFLMAFAPTIVFILRITRVQYKPPIEKLEEK